MRSWTIALCTALLATTAMAATEEAGYYPQGTSAPGSEGGCGTLQFHSDGVYENGYAWSNDGVVAPDFGAFADRYSVPSYHPICALVFDLTQTGTQAGQTLDAYIWDSYADQPGVVIQVVTGVDPGPVAFWPSVSRHVVDTGGINCPIGDVWVGFWGDWPGATHGWFIAADLTGFASSPSTKIAPGIGYPTGWNDVSLVWGPTNSLGVGLEVDLNADCDIFGGVCCLPDGSCYPTGDPYDCEAQGGDYTDEYIECDPNPCGPTPVAPSSWGRIKAYFSGDPE